MTELKYGMMVDCHTICLSKNCWDHILLNQGETKEKIIELIRNNPYITQKEMRELLGLSQSVIEYQIKNLKQDGVIKRVGGDRGGHWEVVK